jgi:peptidoglycan hydrolase FlgJ
MNQVAGPSTQSTTVIEPRTPPRALQALKATQEDAMRVGRQFEQMFLSQMLTPMFEGISSNGTFGGGKGEEMFRSFQVDAYAQAISRRGGIGIAQQVAREILLLQEKPNG